MKNISNNKAVNAQARGQSPTAYLVIGRVVRGMTYPAIGGGMGLVFLNLTP